MTPEDIYEYTIRLCRVCTVVHCANRRPYRVIRVCTSCEKISSIRFTRQPRDSYERYPYHQGYCPYGKKTYVEVTGRCLACVDALLSLWPVHHHLLSNPSTQ